MSHPRASTTTALDVVEIGPAGATAIKTIGPAEPYLSGHYPGNPVYPGVFLLDLCEKLVSACPAVERPFDHLNSLRFSAPTLPGDRIRIELTLRRSPAGQVVGATFLGRSDTPDAEKKFTARMSYS
ncbi:3-hydroxyacyl-ACP dehydratase FabZ family protein [Nocardia sp. NPDC088792]|uniref:3-hydroxyacyl-ACP dehydratase FabZ family protein n=1 Tax=Nocardia sp. NPDC088792 TaxID=3364332 RepID=UPI00381C8F86